jgi:hypothetical protein
VWQRAASWVRARPILSLIAFALVGYEAYLLHRESGPGFTVSSFLIFFGMLIGQSLLGKSSLGVCLASSLVFVVLLVVDIATPPTSSATFTAFLMNAMFTSCLLCTLSRWMRWWFRVPLAPVVVGSFIGNQVTLLLVSHIYDRLLTTPAALSEVGPVEQTEMLVPGIVGAAAGAAFAALAEVRRKALRKSAS